MGVGWVVLRSSPGSLGPPGWKEGSTLEAPLLGWMDGWLDGWMDRWMDGWMDGWMD